jgi:hypothetical protein
VFAVAQPRRLSSTDGPWAVIFRPWPDEPIFHALEHRDTRCGRAVGLYTPLLPLKHVRKFARPCRSCWPS